MVDASFSGVGKGQLINVASNESALGASQHAVAAAKEAAETIERYPDNAPERLAEKIGEVFSLDPSRIACGFGSDDLLSRIARAYLSPGDELIYSVNGYQKCPNYAYANDARPVAAPDNNFRADVDAILDCVTDRTRVVMLANPDNPTGSHISGEEVRRLRERLPECTLLVVDSAYAEYAEAPDYEPATKLVDEHDNVVMTRTFSKVFGMAGLRIGWLYGSSDLVDVIKRIGITFPISGPALAAATAALDDTTHLENVLAHNRTWRQWFRGEVRRLGLHPYPSETNFVLVRFDDPAKPAVEAEAFLRRRSIVARRFGAPNFRDCVRFTIGLEHEMRSIVDVLAEYLEP
jgi:histidinol-phosphate aminotransferase